VNQILFKFTSKYLVKLKSFLNFIVVSTLGGLMMSIKVIELLGPAGVGKTTLMEELKLISSNFITQHDLLVEFHSTRSKGLKVARLFGKVPFIRNQLDRLMIINTIHKGLMTLKSESDMSSLIKYLNLLKCNSNDYRNIEARYLLYIRAILQKNLAHSSTHTGYVIFDEGFGQRGLSLTYHGCGFDSIRDYCKSTFLPDILVNLVASEDLITDRLHKRNGSKVLINNHVEKIELALEASKLIAEKFRDKGTIVIELDVSKASSVIASELLFELEKHF